MKFDCTPQQYHHGLDILWQALGNPSMDGRTVWERVRDRIRDLEAQLAEANAWKAAFMQEHEDWMKIAEGLRNELAEARLKALKAASGAESVHDTKG